MRCVPFFIFAFLGDQQRHTRLHHPTEAHGVPPQLLTGFFWAKKKQTNQAGVVRRQADTAEATLEATPFRLR